MNTKEPDGWVQPLVDDREKICAVSAVAHDLQAPLQVLGLSLRGLRLGSNNREAADLSKTAEAAYEEVTAIVGDLVDVLQLGGGAELPREEGVGIASLLGGVERRFRRKASELGVDLRTKATPVKCVSDRRLLRRVLDNLVGNALKHSGATRVLVLARLRARQRLVLEVLDNGCGISSEELQLVFNQGYRGNEARSRNVRGQGLGLWVVGRLATALGGTVAVRSTVGRGTRFTVEVPTYSVLAPQVAPHPVHHVVSSALQGKMIAVLDDDFDSLHAIQDSLEGLGAVVFAVRDELHFLATVTALGSAPDLALVELGLRGGTAERVLDTLLSRFGEELRLAILTACPTDARLERYARKATILAKPLTTERITQLVALAAPLAALGERSAIAAAPVRGEMA